MFHCLNSLLVARRTDKRNDTFGSRLREVPILATTATYTCARTVSHLPRGNALRQEDQRPGSRERRKSSLLGAHLLARYLLAKGDFRTRCISVEWPRVENSPSLCLMSVRKKKPWKPGAMNIITNICSRFPFIGLWGGREKRKGSENERSLVPTCVS